MKIRLLCLFLLPIFLFNNLNAQVINIPDENFLQKLLEASPSNIIAMDINHLPITIDLNKDGKIQTEEAQLVYSLNIEHSQIKDLSGIEHFTNLNHLSCKNNDELTQISLNDSLKSLELTNNNKITSFIISNLQNIKNISIYENYNLKNITFNNLPSLTMLLCSKNYHLSEINFNGLPKLEILESYNNQITQLNLTNLPSLRTLFCANNQISKLDLSNLPNLTGISCYENQLTSLDLSNNIKINSFILHDNPLEFLNLKGSGFEKYDNVELNYSIDKSKLKHICINPEYINYTINFFKLDNVAVNSYCNFTPGGIYYTLSGKSKLNLNTTTCESGSENHAYLKVVIDDTKTTQNFISDKSGNYKIYLLEGKYTLAPQLGNPDYFSVYPSSLTLDTSTLTEPDKTVLQDFCLTPIGTNNDLEISIIPLKPVRPGFESDYKIIYKNKGNTTLSGTVSLTYQNSLISLISSKPAVSSHAINSLNWDYTNLKPFESGEILIAFRVSPPPAVNNDDILSFSTQITPVDNDETKEDNSFELKQSVVGSFDPNDKTCLEGNTITPDMVGNYVHYLIRFENTGTYEAENIVVKDIIDTSKFDISTLQITDASHPQFTRITNGNTVEFVFEGIKLPHTEPDRHGYIAFKIKTNPNLSIGDELRNQADIFFDYNLPITTNEALTSIEETLGTDEINSNRNEFKIFPNPVKDILYFTSRYTIKKAEIFDNNGRLLKSSQLTNNQINVNHLTSGVYIITLYSDKGNKIQSKFIKQ